MRPPLRMWALLIPGLAAPLSLVAEEGGHPQVRQIMREHVIPLSAALFAAAGEIPQDPATWQATALQARELAAFGSSLQDLSPFPTDSVWPAEAMALAKAASEAALAALARDGERLSSAGEALYASCDGCHRAHFHPEGP